MTRCRKKSPPLLLPANKQMFLSLIFFPFQMAQKRVLLVGDSIIQGQTGWSFNKKGRRYQCDGTCFRGCTTSRLTSKIERRRVDISPYDKIIIHIGTNDILQKDLRDLKIDFIELIAAVQQHNSQATLIFSLPLPRPRDLHCSWPIQNTLNKWIIKHQQHGDYKAWRTYMTFLEKRSRITDQPILKDRNMYRTDGLHLTDYGSQVMLQQVKMAISLTD